MSWPRPRVRWSRRSVKPVWMWATTRMGPGRTVPAIIDAPVSSVDLAPTLLAAAGIDATDLPGLNLLPVAEGRSEVEVRPVFGAAFAHPPTSTDPAVDVTFRWARRGPWKIIDPIDRDESAQLYRVADDPEERWNLAAEQKQELARLRKQLDAWWNPRNL